MDIKTKTIKNIVIVGDSFSSDIGDYSWITKLSNRYNIKNFSQRGISEYRLYRIVLENIEEIFNADAVIIFHTNTDRIFVPDHVSFQSRQLSTHTQMDMVANDALTDKSFKKIAGHYYRYFYDQDQQNCVYQLLVEKIDQLITTKKIHCSGFNVECDTVAINLFEQVRLDYPGTINHLNSTGNQLVYNYLESVL